jgi:hypothetical protein
MTKPTPILLALAVALAAVPNSLSAQVPQVQLGARIGSIAEPFSDLMNLAELNDGRVMVSDRIEKAYFVADLKSGARKVVGRNGTGPNEYQTPFGPIRWKGDTLLGHDPNNRRSLKIAQDGSVIGTLPFGQPRMDGINGWGGARAVDKQGRIYWDLPIIEREPVIKRSQKAQIVRWTPGAPEGPEHVMHFADHGDFEHEYRFRPIPQTDAWVMDRDGRIGILSAARYQLTWYKDGKVVETGPVVAHTPIFVSATERNAWRAQKALEPAAGGLNGASSGAPVGLERVKATYPDSLFPDRLPPFQLRGAHLSPSGDVWVLRTSSASEKVKRVDILDNHGKLRATLPLPAGRRFFEFGASSVYLIATDDDGLQTLEKYALPALPPPPK